MVECVPRAKDGEVKVVGSRATLNHSEARTNALMGHGDAITPKSSYHIQQRQKKSFLKHSTQET
jgi:hypothetical protein